MPTVSTLNMFAKITSEDELVVLAFYVRPLESSRFEMAWLLKNS